MAIQESQMNSVKAKATISLARAKARQGQVNAHAQVLKAKQMIAKAQQK